ncbi:DOPA 4,5-dioxygenase family protein [Nitrosomonas sp. wSCUT-2]
MEKFHVHLYFTKNEIELAQKVRDELIRAIPQLIYVGELVLQPIGPHSKPMFEIHIPATEIDQIAAIIDKKRSGLSVLIHPVQDDELAAHTVFARWLGDRLKLDLNNLNPAKDTQQLKCSSI